MKRLFFIGLVAAAAISARPVGAQPPATYNWTGWYVGVEGGGGWGMAGVRGIANDARLSGVVGGLQGGDRWQNGNWVYGFEGNFDASHIHGSVNWGGVPYSGTIDYFGTFEGHAGWLLTPASLISATGGFAFGGVSAKLVDIDTFKASHVMNGWTVGAVYELKFNPSTTFFVSYKYLDLGEKTFVLDDPERVHVRANVVKAGWNWQFSTR
ncbi:MAG TPA: outer membrane beta-barrel protein [Xanthobacteraceae bacterium]|nr:outer membrane beta-barrel protein [Xanthobacteraceae bacterium]